MQDHNAFASTHDVKHAILTRLPKSLSLSHHLVLQRNIKPSKPLSWKELFGTLAMPVVAGKSVAAQTIDMDLPLVENRWHASSNIAAIWLGPDEWLVVGGKGGRATLEKQILAARRDDRSLSSVDL